MIGGRRLSHEIVERVRLMEYPGIGEVTRGVGRTRGVKEESIRDKGSRGTWRGY